MSGRPPRLAAWLLTVRVPVEWRDFVLGDLEEEFASRADRSAAAARAWFWWQTIRCLLVPPPVRRDPQPLDSPGDPWMGSLFSDVRHAVRVMVRTPSFSAAVVGVLALGIGANTAIFSIVNAVLLRPIPFEEPDNLVPLFHTPPQSAFPGMQTFSLSPANFYDWQRDSQSFEGMALYRFRQFALTGTGNARAVLAAAVGAGFSRPCTHGRRWDECFAPTRTRRRAAGSSS